MPIVSLLNHEHRYPVEDVLRLFFGKNVKWIEADNDPFNSREKLLVELPSTNNSPAQNISIDPEMDQLHFKEELSASSHTADNSPTQIRAGENEDSTQIYSILDTIINSDAPDEPTPTQYRIRTRTATGEIQIESDRPISSEIEIKREIKRQLYYISSQLTAMDFPWGSLTGIRPTYVASQLIERMGSTAAYDELCDFFFVSPEKASLAIQTATMENHLLEDFREEDLAIYIGIPYCPTRCSYCSFSSYEGIGRPEAEMDRYLDALIHELEAIWGDAEFRQQLGGSQVRALYIGGGTPTALNATQLDRLCQAIHDLDLPFTAQPELTIEAGRPDTIDPEKLAILKAAGFERISVNPQSMVDETLIRIGRMHGSEAIHRAFRESRAAGFENINMDLIAGLAGESREEFAYSLQEVLALQPESITVHNLAIKRGSRLHRLMTESEHLHNEQQTAEKAIGSLYQPDPDVAWMVSHAREHLEAAGYRSYYLYRQKDGRGGLENVGYSLPRRANLYNIAMMADLRSVMAFGAGSSSKHGRGRQVNLRNIKQYIDRVDEMIEAKRMIWF